MTVKLVSPVPQDITLEITLSPSDWSKLYVVVREIEGHHLDDFFSDLLAAVRGEQVKVDLDLWRVQNSSISLEQC